MSITISITGNPGSKDLSLYNILTGSPEFPDKYIYDASKNMYGKLKDNPDISIVKIPGTYSLSSYTLEERVVRRFLLNERPDALINVIDGAVIKRSLYRVVQLLEFFIPTLVVLNNPAEGTDIKRMSDSLGVPFISTFDFSDDNISEIKKWIADVKGESYGTFGVFSFHPEIEEVLSKISAIAKKEDYDNVIPDYLNRYYAIKFFERDMDGVANHPNAERVAEQVEELILHMEEEFDEDCDNIIVGQRYGQIMELLK